VKADHARDYAELVPFRSQPKDFGVERGLSGAKGAATVIAAAFAVARPDLRNALASSFVLARLIACWHCDRTPDL